MRQYFVKKAEATHSTGVQFLTVGNKETTEYFELSDDLRRSSYTIFAACEALRAGQLSEDLFVRALVIANAPADALRKLADNEINVRQVTSPKVVVVAGSMVDPDMATILDKLRPGLAALLESRLAQGSATQPDTSWIRRIDSVGSASIAALGHVQSIAWLTPQYFDAVISEERELHKELLTLRLELLARDSARRTDDSAKVAQVAATFRSNGISSQPQGTIHQGGGSPASELPRADSVLLAHLDGLEAELTAMRVRLSADSLREILSRATSPTEPLFEPIDSIVVQFGRGSAALPHGIVDSLKSQLGQYLQRESWYYVYGYTDDWGPDLVNGPLSGMRAAQVAKVLTERLGVDRGHVVSQGMGRAPAAILPAEKRRRALIVVEGRVRAPG